MKRRRRSRKHSSSSRSSSRVSLRTLMAALTLGLLGLWGMLPFGGETPWAADSILIGALVATCLLFCLWSDDRRRDASTPPAGGGILAWWPALLLMAAWAVFQWVPLPVNMVRGLQPGWTRLLAGLSPPPSVVSLGVDRSVGITEASLWVALCGLAAATAACFRDRGSVRLLAHVIAGLGTFQAFAALIIPGFTTSWWDAFSTTRLVGTFSNPNALGGLLALTIPVTLGLLLTLQSRLLDIIGSRWKRLLTLSSRHHGLIIEWVVVFLCLLAQLVALIGSGSRGATLAALVSATILFVGYFVMARAARGAALQLAALLLLAVLVIAAGGGLVLLMQRFQADKVIESGLPERLQIWKAAGRLILDFPFGVGAGGMPLVLPVYQLADSAGTRMDYGAHNEYLQWIGEYGLPGLAILGLALGALIWRGLGTIRIAGVRDSVWIWRGAALGVLATLLHAAVDFNLMVYPAIRTLFFVVCGMMIGAARHRSAEPRMPEGSPDPRPAGAGRVPNGGAGRFRQLGAAMLWVCLAVALGMPAFSRMTTAWQVEGARRTLELPPLKAFWIPPPWVPPEHALPVLAEASERRPTDGGLRYWLAMGHLARFEQERAAAIEALRISEEAYGGVAVRQIEAMVDMAMQWDRRQILTLALEQAEQAISLAPWSPEMRTLAARIRGQLADLDGAGPEGAGHRRAAMRWATAAVDMLPYDRGVLIDAVWALADVRRSALLAGDADTVADAGDKLAVWGRRVVAVDAAATGEVLDAWHTAGVLSSELHDLQDLPIPVLREVYDYFADQERVDDALRVLDRLDAAYRISPTPVEEWHRDFVRMQRYRWLLWMADAAAYRDGFDERRALWRRRQQRMLMPPGDAGRSDVAYRLQLSEVDHRVGLSEDNLLNLAQLEWDRGAIDAVHTLLVRCLALGAGLSGTESAGLDRLRAWNDKLGTQSTHYAVVWLDARLVSAAGQSRLAAQRYARLLTNPRLPLRFRHRVLLEQVMAWQAAGEANAALSALERALREGMDDPDVLKAWIEAGQDARVFRATDGRETQASEHLQDLQPAFALGTKFMGERMELCGLSLEPFGARYQMGRRLRLYWRFYDRVPADLRVVLRSRDHDDYLFFSRGEALSELLPDAFSAGEPRVGHVLITNILLPPRALAGDRLEIRLLGGGRRIPSDEGLIRLVVKDWQQILDVDSYDP